ncbi:MAG TPA: rod shape-determining protein MreD [Candidatus Acidoferrales bacterium]|nr:rod shape-determining protein MreD [Candidatus Acidoferrales bacterium]
MNPTEMAENASAPPLMIRGVTEPRLEVHKFRTGAVVGASALALVLQAFVPAKVWKGDVLADLIELPLLATLYFGLSRRNPSRGLLLGMVIGMAQDGLSGANPIGLFGIAKTLVGYLASTIGSRLDVEHPVSRMILAFMFFHLHNLTVVFSRRWLLAQPTPLMSVRILIASLVAALLAWPLFALLDKLRQDED